MLLGNIPDRPEEHLDIRDKGHKDSKTHHLRDHPSSTVKDHDSQGKGTQHVDHGHEKSIDSDLLKPGIIIFTVDFLEVIQSLLFHCKQLNHLHAPNGLGKHRIDLCHLNPQHPEHLPGFSRKKNGRQKHEWDHRQHRSSKLQIHIHQDPQYSQEHKGIFHHKRDDGCKQLLHVLDIVGHPGGKPAHRVLIEKRNGQPLNMPVDGKPQIMHDPLAGVFHYHDLNKAEHKPQTRNPQQHQARQGSPTQILGPQDTHLFLGQSAQVFR